MVTYRTDIGPYFGSLLQQQQIQKGKLRNWKKKVSSEGVCALEGATLKKQWLLIPWLGLLSGFFFLIFIHIFRMFYNILWSNSSFVPSPSRSTPPSLPPPTFVFFIFLNLLIIVCAVHILLDVGFSVRVANPTGITFFKKISVPYPNYQLAIIPEVDRDFMKKGKLHVGIWSGLSLHSSVPLFYVYRPKQDAMTIYEYFNTIKIKKHHWFIVASQV